jgi:uncharacterized protein DUF3455
LKEPRGLEDNSVRYNLVPQKRRTTRVRILLAAALLLGWALGTVTHAWAQTVTPLTTRASIEPPPGNAAFVLDHGVGTQGYVCLPTGTGAASWTVSGARPEATLFARSFGREVQNATHFLSPDTSPNEAAPSPLPFGNATWQSSSDSSKVWAQPVYAIPAGSDPRNCPNAGAISCLLLQSIGSQEGPTGGRIMTQTTFIQRLNTKGGAAPTDGCSGPGDVGKQTLVPYTADYVFFRGAE